MSERPLGPRLLLVAAILAVIAALAVVLGPGLRSEATDAGTSKAAPLDAGDFGANEHPAASSLASLRGTVLDEAGKPAKGALVWAVDTRERFRQARTATAGTFAFEGLPPESYHLAAQRGASVSESVGPLPLGPGDDLRGLSLRLMPGAKVGGLVMDLKTRKPLPGAVVSVVATPVSAVADEQGRFGLPPLPIGGHVLAVQAVAHLPRQIPLQARSGEVIPDLEIYLTPASRLTGSVIAHDGTGVPEAALLASRYPPAPSGQAQLAPVGQTDDQGRFALDLAPGSLELVARSPGFAEATSAVLDLAEGQSQEVKLELGSGAQVNGTVETADGQAVQSGHAQAFRGHGGWQVGDAPLVPGGHFTLTGLPAGHLTIGVEAGQARATAEVDLEEAGEVSVKLRLGDHELAGVVIGAGDRPVEGAKVSAHPVGKSAAGEQTALTGPDGTFKLAGLSGDRFDVTASKDEGQAEARGVAAGRHDLRLTLATGGVSGTVVGPGGLTVSDFYIAAEPELPGRGHPHAMQAVDGHGDFKLSLSQGRYRLRATAPGYSEGEVAGIEVAAGAETRGVRVELRPAGTITGTALEDPTGKPLAGVHVGTDRGHAWSVGRESPLGGSAALSGPDGKFTLRDVAPGSWELYASANGFQQSSFPDVSVVPGQNPSPVEIHLRKDDGSGEKPYAGVGMALFGRDGNTYAGEVFAGGPAQQAGIRFGDQVVGIDGSSALGLSPQDVVHRIRGPEGSEVSLDMRRSGNGEAYSVVVPREEIRF